MTKEVNLKENILESQKKEAFSSLELARRSHEKYLIRSQIGDLNCAVENYIKAIKLDPSLSEGYYRLASLFFENGQITVDAAIEQCKNAVKIDATNPNAYIYTGYFLNLAGKNEEAQKYLHKAIQVSPVSSARARLTLAYTIKEDLDAAEKFDVLKSCKYFYYLCSAGMMYAWDYPSIKMVARSFCDAFSVLRYNFLGNIFEVTKQNSLAIRNYDIAAEKTGRNEIFFNKIGDICVREKAPEIAIDAYRNVIEAAPYNKDALIKLATVLQTYFPDSVDEAIDCYNKLLEIDEQTESVYYELGHLYLKKLDKINAIAAFKLALEKSPQNPFYHNSLAYTLVQLEQYEEAIEHYNLAIRYNPDNEWTAIVCQALGLVYDQILENEEAALAMYNTAILLDPNSIESFISIGDIYFDKGDINNAIKAFCDAVNTDASNPQAYCKLGISLWEKEYVEEAVIAYNKAIELNPEYDIAMNNLGVIYLDGIGIVSEAKKLFSKAIEVNPNYTLAYFNLARCYEADGDKTKAAEYYQITLDLNKITEDVDEEDITTRLFNLFEV